MISGDMIDKTEVYKKECVLEGHELEADAATPSRFSRMMNTLLSAIRFMRNFLTYPVTERKRLNDTYELVGRNSRALKAEQLLPHRPSHQYYHLRQEDYLIRDGISKGSHVLVVGHPLSGKTRAIYEALKAASPPLSVTIPRCRDVNVETLPMPINLPWQRRHVLILDDADKVIEKNGHDFLIKAFLRRGAIIVATCRSGTELEKLRSSAEWLYSLFQGSLRDNVIELTDMPDKDGKMIADMTGHPWDQAGFDGKPGSMLMNMESMRKRFDESSPEEKAILRAAGLLYLAGITEQREVFSTERILHACITIYGLRGIPQYQQAELLNNLETKGFAKMRGEEEVWAEEAYLSLATEPELRNSSPLDVLRKVHSIFENNPDAQLLLGNRALILGAGQSNGAEYIKLSIKAYSMALRNRTPDRLPMAYAGAQNNLGIAYVTLARVEDKEENCRKAIEAYREALHIYTLWHSPVSYAATRYNMGVAYAAMAESENTSRVENCRKAIRAYEEALRVRTVEHLPIDYAVTQDNLGNAYRALAEADAHDHDRVENCKKAIQAYLRALEIFTIKRFPVDYAATQNNLGKASRTLAEKENPIENCKKAIQAYHEALHVYIFGHLSVDYAETQDNLGQAYQTLAEAQTEYAVGNCRGAIQAYSEALRVRNFEQMPEDYAATQNNLGVAYATLAQVQDSAENCENAIQVYREALRVRTIDRFPSDYAVTQNNLGNAYAVLARVVSKARNCKRAIKAYREALRVRTIDHSPSDYAATQNNLGVAHGTLAQEEDKAKNCKKAIQAYNESLRVYTPDHFSADYAGTQNNLGTAYETLAEVEDKTENSRKAIQAYDRALRALSEETFPQKYRGVMANVQRALQSFS